MYLGKTLFAQIMDFLPWKRFHRIVARRNGDHYVKHFSCAEQFRVMAFAQLSYRESLRDIELCLSAQATKLYHMGLSQPVKRVTLAEANERRDWRIFAEFAQCLIDEARGLYAAEPFGIDLAGVTSGCKLTQGSDMKLIQTHFEKMAAFWGGFDQQRGVCGRSVTQETWLQSPRDSA